MSREDSMVFSGQNAGVGVFVGKDSFNPDGQNAGRHRLALASLSCGTLWLGCMDYSTEL